MRQIKSLWPCRKYVRMWGLQGLMIFRILRSARKTVVAVSIPEYGLIHLRSGTPDVTVLEHVLIDKDYDYSYPIEPQTIIDLGAHIGLSAIWFAKRFPNARIFCVEPDPSNFEILVENLRNYGERVVCINAAISSVPVESLPFLAGASHAGRIAGKEQSQCDCIDVSACTVAEIMRDYALSQVDLLKIDIEGYERELFSSESGWLEMVSMCIIEVHEELARGATLAIYSSFNDFRICFRHGEHDIFWR